MSMDMTLIPYVVEQTGRGERSYDIFSRLLDDRIIMLNDQVDNNSASVIIAQMLYLEGKDPEKDISFYINSPGGSVSAGLDDGSEELFQFAAVSEHGFCFLVRQIVCGG